MRTAREAREWSQAELSRQLKEAGLTQFHPTTVARVEKNERQVRLDEAPVIARIFGATVDQMMLPADRFSKVLTYLGLAEERRRCVSQLKAWGKRMDENREKVGQYLAEIDAADSWDVPIGEEQVSTLRGWVEAEPWRVIHPNPPPRDPWWAGTDEPPF